MIKKIFAALSFLSVISIASAQYSDNFYFNIQVPYTPKNPFHIISASSNQAWYTLLCSNTYCSFAIQNFNEDNNFYVTIGQDSQHACQLWFQTNAAQGDVPHPPQNMNLLAQSNCNGWLTFQQLQNNGTDMSINMYFNEPGKRF